MSTDSIEKLYKNFGVLADAKDKIGEVNPFATTYMNLHFLSSHFLKVPQPTMSMTVRSSRRPK